MNMPLPSKLMIDNDLEEPLVITAAQLAKLLQVSLRTLWRLNSAKRLPAPVRLGGTVRWRFDEIRIWIAEGCPPPELRENIPRRR